MSVLATELEKPKIGYRQVFANRNYLKLLLAQFVSNFGDGVYAMGLLWAMKELTGSSLMMSYVAVAQVIPTIVFGLIGGVVADRGNKKQLMIRADFFRGLIVLLLAIMWWTGGIQPWMLILTAALLATFTAFFNPAKNVAIRTVVPDEHNLQAQSISSTVSVVVGLGAPVVAAVLISYSLFSVFLLDAVSFFVSLLFIRGIHHSDLLIKKPEKLSLRLLRSNLREGFVTIVNIPILRNLIIYFMLLNFLFAPFSLLIPIYAATPTMLASMQMAFFIGILVGSIAAGYVGRLPRVVTIGAGLGCVLFGVFALAVWSAVPVAVSALFLVGFGITIVNLPLNSLFMTTVPREVMGRASSMQNLLVQFAKPVSMSLTGTLLLAVSIREFLLGIAGLGVCVVILMVLNPHIRKSTT
jgi:MFS family permease